VLFRLDDGHRLIARAVPFEEGFKPSLYGPIVVIKPAMYRQGKVCLRTVTVPLQDPDLCRGDIDLRVLSLPMGLGAPSVVLRSAM
jgi:hypothetical protein